MAWKLATLAKQSMARKLKNICEVWKMTAGFEMIIYEPVRQRDSKNRQSEMTASHTTHSRGTKSRRTSVPDWFMETTNDYVKRRLTSVSCVLLNRRGRMRSSVFCNTSSRGMVGDEDDDEEEEE